jgi:hypothetical protein
MYMTMSQAINLTEDSLRQFLQLAIDENTYLDYKRDLSKENDKSDKDPRREFLKDVSAFANAAGGHIIIGALEPNADRTIDDQLVGIERGDAIAQDLERLTAASIDPRIPGLTVKPVSLSSGKWAIVIHVPPSYSRPHMVTYQKYRTFYIRHSESSLPMSTHEVREAVLTAASASDRARLYAANRLSEVRADHAGIPVFVLQAVPLITPEEKWNVLDKAFINALRGEHGYRDYSGYSLHSMIAPTPTIDGLMGSNARQSWLWRSDVHRTGYVSVLHGACRMNETEGYVVDASVGGLFKAFCSLLSDVWKAAASDLPYLISCAYLNASTTRLGRSNSSFRGMSDFYDKPDLIWPEHIRLIGDDPMPIADELLSELFNAFGEYGPSRA